MLQQLIDAYREHGHLKASLDPLGLMRTSSPPYPLEPQAFGLLDSDGEFAVQDVLPGFPRSKGSLHEVVAYLEHMYCGTMSLESAHISVSVNLSMPMYVMLVSMNNTMVTKPWLVIICQRILATLFTKSTELFLIWRGSSCTVLPA